MNTAAVARQLCGGWSSTCCGWCKFCCLCTLTVIKVSNGKLISGCRKASWLTCSYCMVLRQVSTKSQDFQHVSHWQSPCRICFLLVPCLAWFPKAMERFQWKVQSTDLWGSSSSLTSLACRTSLWKSDCSEPASSQTPLEKVPQCVQIW